MGSYAAEADDDDEGVAQLGEALVGEEDAVAGELLEDELVVEVAGLGPPRQRLVAKVLLVDEAGGR